MQLNAGPLEAALLQHMTRRRVQHPCSGEQLLDGEFLESIIDNGARGFRCEALAPVLDTEAVAKFRRVFVFPAHADKSDHVARMLDSLTPREKPTATPIVAITRRELPAWLKSQSAMVRNWLDTNGFRGEHGKVAMVPGKDGKLAQVVLGLGDGSDLWDYAAPVGKLPAGRYRFSRGVDGDRKSVV